MTPPVFIYCCTGITHLVYCVWAVRSLYRFDYHSIEIVVKYPWEKAFLTKYLPDVPCEVLSVDLEGYTHRMWGFRHLVMENYQIKSDAKEVVICDTDILWKQDPRILLKRFEGKPWVHKIIALNPADLYLKEVSAMRLGLRTMIHYKNREGLTHIPSYQVNGGLFLLKKELYTEVLKNLLAKIRALPPEEMLSTEALLSIVYAEMGLSPACDRPDIKHLDAIQRDPVDLPVGEIDVADATEGEFTGYETATHYFGDQRPGLHRDAKEMGLDPEHLIRFVHRDQLHKKLKKIPAKLKRLLSFEQSPKMIRYDEVNA